jgi:hypothetical protein
LKFITDPIVVKAGRPIAMIPHYRTQEEFNAAVDYCAGAKPDAFLVHQTFEGAIAETGVRLSGLSASPIELLKPPLGVYAGDVHRPQTQGWVTYVGCPYQVRFGDDFEPRCIHVSKSGVEAYPWFEAPRKWALTVRGAEDILGNKNLYEKDQVKLTIELAREESIGWKKVKQEVLTTCKKRKLQVYGVKVEVRTTKQKQRIKLQEKYIKDADVFDLFCKAENVASEIKQVGKDILNGNEDVLRSLREHNHVTK